MSSTNQLLQQAAQLAKSGQRDQARHLIIQVLKTDSQNVTALWALANITWIADERRKALNAVLRLQPNHERARAMLARLDAEHPAEVLFEEQPLATTALPFDSPLVQPYTAPIAPAPPPRPASKRAISSRPMLLIGGMLSVGVVVIAVLALVLSGMIGGGDEKDDTSPPVTTNSDTGQIIDVTAAAVSDSNPLLPTLPAATDIPESTPVPPQIAEQPGGTGLGSAPISAANADQVRQLATLGAGEIEDFQWSPDGHWLAVSTGLGIWLYEAADLTKPPKFIGGDTNPRAVLFSWYDSQLLAFTDSLRNEVVLWDIVNDQPRHTVDLAMFSKRQTDYWLPFAISPDASTIVLTQYYGGISPGPAIVVWDVVNNRQGAVYSDQPDLDYTETLSSPDHTHFAGPGSDKTWIDIFETMSGSSVRVQLEQPVPLMVRAFNTDASLLAATSDGAVYVWDTRSGQTQYVLSVPSLTYDSGGVLDADLKRFSELFTDVSENNVIRNWDIPTGVLLSEITLPDRAYSWHFKISPDGNMLASYLIPNVGDLYLWDVNTGSQIGQFEDYGGDLAFNLVGTQMAYADHNGALHVVDIMTMAELQVAPLPAGHMSGVDSVVFSRDGSLLASGDSNGILLWDVADRSIQNQLGSDDVFEGSPLVVGFSPDGTTLLVVNDHSTQLWDVVSGQLRARSESDAEDEAEAWPAISPDGLTVAVIGTNGMIRLLNMVTGEVIAKLLGHDGYVNGLAYSPDGQILYSAGDDQTIRQWHVSTGAQLQALRGHTAEVEFVSTSPDGQYLVSGDSEDTWLLWRLTDYAVQASFEAREEISPLVPFSPDSHWLVMPGYGGDYGCDIGLQNLQTGAVTILDGHTGWYCEIGGLVFSYDNTLLASVGNDGFLLLWGTLTGAELARHWLWDEMNAMSMNPDGTLIATAGDDGVIRLWGIP